MTKLFSSKRFRLGAVTFLFGAVGAYLVFGAKAAVIINSYNDGELGSGISAGEVFLVTTTASNIPAGTGHFGLVEFSADGGVVESLGTQCAPPVTCSLSVRPKAYSGEFDPVYMLCADLPAGTTSATFSMRFRALANLPANTLWFSYFGGATDGSCADSDDPRKDPPPPPPDPPPGCPECEGNDGDNPGNNTGPDGGGGSSATNQGDADNSTPSSSGQGDAKQPKVEPSPFFDGKLFATGSDSFTTTDTVSIAGYRLGYGWFYLLAGLILTSLLGLLGWKYRAQLNKHLISLRQKLHI